MRQPRAVGFGTDDPGGPSGMRPARGHVADRGLVPTLVLLSALLGCGTVSFAYRQTASPPDLAPVLTVMDETFVVQLRNNTATSLYVDWATARFVDVVGQERPLRLVSEENVGSPNVPLDPDASIIYQLEPTHFYVLVDRRWARRTSLRHLITYEDAFAAAPEARRVVLRVGYCVGTPCASTEACCGAGGDRLLLEVPLDVVEEGSR